jgi:hypothetical protein
VAGDRSRNRLTAEAHIAGWGLEQGDEFTTEAFTLFFPAVAVGRFRHPAGNAPGVVIFVKAAHQRVRCEEAGMPSSY